MKHADFIMKHAERCAVYAKRRRPRKPMSDERKMSLFFAAWLESCEREWAEQRAIMDALLSFPERPTK